MKNISFIGLGNMGFEMAINLSKSGFNVIGFDINQEKYKQLEEKNVKCVSSIVEISEVSITSGVIFRISFRFSSIELML